MKYEFKGKKYTSLSDIARDYGINEITFLSRLNRGWTMEEAVNGSRNGQEIIFRNKKYKSISELARNYGIKERTFRSRLRLGWTMEEAVNGYRDGEIVFRGKKYRSLTDIAREYGIKEGTFQSRLNRGWSIEEALELKERKADRKRKKIIVEDIEYSNIAEAAKAYGLPGHRVRYRLKSGWSIEEAFELEERKNKGN